MSNWRKLAPIFSVLIIGLINLYNVAGNPRFQAFRTIDVVRLILTGMCLGLALGLLVMFFRGARSS